MTLAASGALSMGGSTANRSVNLELSQAATTQISLNDTNVRALAGVPSGAITLATDFYGKSAITVNFINASVLATSAGTASAGFRIESDGFAYEFVNGTSTALYQWVTPTSVAGDYEVFVTVTSGSLTSGTTGSWVPTAGSQLWVRSATTTGTFTAELSMQVRKVGTATVLDTWTVSLEAERF